MAVFSLCHFVMRALRSASLSGTVNACWKSCSGNKTRHSFFATADLELFRVLLGRPLPVNTERLPHLIERHEMSMEFCVRQDTITVENQASLHALLTLVPRCRRSP